MQVRTSWFGTAVITHNRQYQSRRLKAGNDLAQSDRQLPYNQSVRMRQGKHVQQTRSRRSAAGRFRQRGDKGISTVIVQSSWQLKGSMLLELWLFGLRRSTDQCFRWYDNWLALRLNIHLHYNCNCFIRTDVIFQIQISWVVCKWISRFLIWLLSCECCHITRP